MTERNKGEKDEFKVPEGVKTLGEMFPEVLENTFATTIELAHMEPTLLVGDTVIIDPKAGIVDGKVYLIAARYMVPHFARLYNAPGDRVTIRYDNPHIKPMEVGLEGIVIKGRVIKVWRNI